MDTNTHPLADDFRALIATPDLPDLGSLPRPSRLSADELESRLGAFFAAKAVAAPLQPLLRSAALLWHDHLDPCHQLSRPIPTTDGNFLHGIMHRREGAYANAKSCFHRVGRHGAFREIARQATRSLTSERQNELLARLVPNGLWDPFALIDICEQVAGAGEADPRRPALAKVQEIEFNVLLAQMFVDAGRPSSTAD
jgi:hypothetical protein